MKVVILAGGLPSSISGEEEKLPKPMVKIGERPILWHIMKLYSHYGFNDFIICTGYKADSIKNYFLDYYVYSSDISVDLKTNHVTILNQVTEPWRVTVVDTGITTTTAERIGRIRSYIDEEAFIICYGDCITDLNVEKMLDEYQKKERTLLMAVARPTGRNTVLNLSDEGYLVSRIALQNNTAADAWVNTCHMVVHRDVFSILDPKESFELQTVNRLMQSGQVTTYKHEGFWTPVETVRDRMFLENLWQSGSAPWRVWESK